MSTGAPSIPKVFRVEFVFAEGDTESYIELGGTLLEHWRAAVVEAGIRTRVVRSVRITQGHTLAKPCSADVCTLEEAPPRDPLATLEGPPRHFAVVVRRPGMAVETYRRIGGSSCQHLIEAMDLAGINGRICVRPVAGEPA